MVKPDSMWTSIDDWTCKLETTFVSKNPHATFKDPFASTSVSFVREPHRTRVSNGSPKKKP